MIATLAQVVCVICFFGELPRQAVIEKALEARSSLTPSYHLIMSIDFLFEQAGSPPTQQDQLTQVEVWVKGRQVRVDETKERSTFDKNGVGRRRIIGRHCERQGFGIFTSTGGGVGLTEQVGFHTLDDRFDALDGFRIDWRRLGQLHGFTGTYRRGPPDASLRHMLRVKGTSELVNLDGRSCYSVAETTRAPNTNRYLFDPASGMNPIKMESYDDASDFRMSTEIDNSPTKLGVWFPSKVTHTHWRAGRQVLREQITIKAANLNVDIPPAIFTLAGMNLDSGQPVAFPEIADPVNYPVWDGTKLDTVGTLGKRTASHYREALAPPAPLREPIPDVAPPAPRWLHYAGAAACVTLAGLLYLWVRRRGES